MCEIDLLVENLAEVEPTMAVIRHQKFRVVFLPLCGFLHPERSRVAALAVARRLATLSGLRELPEAGGLFSSRQSWNSSST